MRATAALIWVCALLAGCAVETSSLQRSQSGRPSDEWGVTVRVEPEVVSPIAVSVGPVHVARPNGAHPWIEHEVVFENKGNRAVRFDDTRTSRFIGPSGHRRRLLAGDEGCGYSPQTRQSRLEAGVCRLYLDAFELKPYGSESRKVTLFAGLRGMERLAAGKYVFRKLLRFAVGHNIPAEGTGRTAVLRLTYNVRR